MENAKQGRLTIRTVHIAGWEARKADAEHYTSAIGVARRLDGATNGRIGEGVGAGQGRDVRGTSRIALDDLCVSELACGARDDRAVEGGVALNDDRGGGRWRRRVLGIDEGKARQSNGQDGRVHVCRESLLLLAMVVMLTLKRKSTVSKTTERNGRSSMRRGMRSRR